MDLRIALVGPDPLRLKALEAELHLEGVPVTTATSAETLAPVVRQLNPTAIIAIADLASPVEAQGVAQLLIHPSTSGIPILAMMPRLETRSAVRALRSGVIEVMIGAPQGKALLDKAVAVLGSTADDPRRRAAMDRRGPTVLRRIGDFLRANEATGVLAIRGDEIEGKMRFSEGQIRAASVAGQEGGEAIRYLLAHSTHAPWDFLLVTEAELAAAEEVLELTEAVEVDVDIDILDAEDMPSSPGMPVVSDEPQPLRVLLADDDPDLLTMYSAFMRREGWKVETAENGRRAYDIAMQHRPDVIVSDIMMPETDGWGFLTSVRGDYRLREIPFLLLSCHGDYLHNLEHLDAGANDYLEKGLRGDEVVARINQAAGARARFAASCDPAIPMSGKLEETGAGLLLRTLSERGATGTLIAKAGWIEVTVKLKDGRSVLCESVMGTHIDSGDDALCRLLGMDGGNYTWLPGAVEDAGRGVYFPDVSDDLAVSLNRKREQEHEHFLAGEGGMVFNDERIDFYERVCADPIRPITDLLRQGQSPRAVMASGAASPLLVEWVVKDLLRKGIARFA
jgi:DNA-binding response OmpR family regulator